MSRKPLFDTPLTAKQRALRSNANLRKAGGEVLSLRLDKATIDAITYLLQTTTTTNRADCIRKAVQSHSAYIQHLRGEHNA